MLNRFGAAKAAGSQVRFATPSRPQAIDPQDISDGMAWHRRHRRGQLSPAGPSTHFHASLATGLHRNQPPDADLSRRRLRRKTKCDRGIRHCTRDRVGVHHEFYPASFGTRTNPVWRRNRGCSCSVCAVLAVEPWPTGVLAAPSRSVLRTSGANFRLSRPRVGAGSWDRSPDRPPVGPGQA
jgi:hypothetical protein